jgi:acetyl-CoA carboxylase / biotin carboxylase 1
VDLICKIAEEEKCHAVWPGWGHASENPDLPRKLKERGIQFLGPNAGVMFALGDKVCANILAQTAKVPSIPWSGEGVELELNANGEIDATTVDEKTGEKTFVSDEVFRSACCKTKEEAVSAADKIGYPVMIKASEGGGGKGIRERLL